MHTADDGLNLSAPARAQLAEMALAAVQTRLSDDLVSPAVMGSGAPLRPAIAADPADAGTTLAALLKTLATGANTRSPRYLGYLPAGGLFTAAVADFLAAALNPYAGLAAVSPGAAALESDVVRWLNTAVGMPQTASGVLTSGGSLATLTAVIAAREAYDVPARGAHRFVVYAGEHRHHSIDRALRFAGLSDCPLRVVPSDKRYRMDAGALRRLLADDAASGLTPWLVVATAGTTSSGSVDPLADVIAAARRAGAWVHVDAAYGGLFRLSEKAADVLAGVGDADTVVVDPHKSLFLPYGSGALLARERSLLLAPFGHEAAYLEQGDDAGPDSPADLGLELSRPFRALRVWLPLQLSGTRAFADALTAKLVLARGVHAELALDPRLEVGPAPDLAVVTFRPLPVHGDADAFTAEVARRLRADGEVFLTTTRLDGRLTLRVAVGSARTGADDVRSALKTVLRVVDAVRGQ
jgi:glutamate/tyrosine decarboxylase-like PLP-dependent enzyme